MQLDNMRVAIRPMSTAQAVDLGFMMARHWFVPLWKIWVGMAFPIFVLYLLVIIIDSRDMDSLTLTTIAGMVFWWLKPIYEKPLVEWLGQALFDNQLSVKTSIKQGWKNFFRHAGKLLIRHRLSPSRQLILPILQLENLTQAHQFNQRIRLLQRGQGSGVTWHTLIMVHLEFVISVGIIVYLYQLIPQELIASQGLFQSMDHTQTLLVIAWAFLYFFTLSIVAPFFICGGFCIYLTKRCLLEGWDIELIFRQLGTRFIEAQRNPLSRL